LEIFEIQRPLVTGFLKISHHRIIIIAERRLRPRTEEQRRFKRRRRRIKRTETHRWSRQNREPDDE
jgi:F0F1-type ATP synthase epsilon subunit